MAQESGIAWTRSTFNPWIGCTKVSPGCDHCYAEVSRPSMAFGIKWGAGQPRHRTGRANWDKPLNWNRLAAMERETGRVSAQSVGWTKPGFWPVFCASLADVFDNEVPDEWRLDLWNLIYETPYLSWLLVTKRIGNVSSMVPASWMPGKFPPNLRLMITVVNQEEADRDIPKLLALPCKNGISYEPALGPVDWSRWLVKQCDAGSVPGPHGIGGVMCPRCHGSRISGDGCPGLQWIIVGGESSQPGHPARPFNIEWARSTVRQCKATGTACFVKQLGSSVLVRNDSMEEWPDEDAFSDAIPDDYRPAYQGEGVCIRLQDRAGADPAEWPADLQIREFPTTNQGV